MNTAYLKDSVVVLIAPEGYAPPATLDYDATMDATGASVGDTWDGTEFVKSGAVQADNRHITRLAFRQRFTQAEMVMIEMACLDDPAADMSVRQQAAALRVMQRQVAEANYIDLDRADTRAGVQMLEAAGLLAAGRALEILDAEVTDMERPL